MVVGPFGNIKAEASFDKETLLLCDVDLRDNRKIRDAIADGCGTDAPGSLVAWMCRHSVLHSMEMPGSRYDIGNLESYESVKKHYRGITR